MRRLLLLALLPCIAMGQAKPRAKVSTTTAAGSVPFTTANTSLFVDRVNGSDSNACTASGTGACATINGALALVPKGLRHLVTVTVAAGAGYGGFYAAGFQCLDPPAAGGSVGLTIGGTESNSTTLATGTASGTASATTPGTNSTYDTLTDGTQTWTVNDLRGRELVVGAAFMTIVSNTATVITIAGHNAAITGTPAYTIQQAKTVVDTPISGVVGVFGAVDGPNGFQASGPATRALGGNGCVTVQKFEFNSASMHNCGVIQSGNVSFAHNRCLQMFNSGLSVSDAVVFAQSNYFADLGNGGLSGIAVALTSFSPELFITNNVFNLTTNMNAVDSPGWSHLIGRFNAMLMNGAGGFGYALGLGGDITLRNDQVTGAAECLHGHHNTSRTGYGAVAVDGMVCTSPSANFVSLQGPYFLMVDQLNFGASSGANASAAPIFTLNKGAKVAFSTNTTWTAASAGDISLDVGEGGGAGTLSTIAAIKAASPKCISSITYGSDACVNN